MVCANSNAACDTITERLVDVLSINEVFRMYAKSFNQKALLNKIRPICNLVDGQFKFPSLDFLYQYRVVVCTLTTAGCIVKARGVDKNFDPAHFAYVVIDEAACVQETSLLIPIAGIIKLIQLHLVLFNHFLLI